MDIDDYYAFTPSNLQTVSRSRKKQQKCTNMLGPHQWNNAKIFAIFKTSLGFYLYDSARCGPALGRKRSHTIAVQLD